MDDDALFDIEVRALLEAVFLRYQHDFRDYSPASLRRRLRLALQQLDCARVSELQDRVLRDPSTFARLLQYFTVQVSEMFRDPDYYRALRTHVVPVMATYPSLKVWVAGCAHGEEVWSLAVLLAEEDMLERTLIYATDIQPDALRHAEAGLYPIDRIAQYSRNYLAAGGRRSLSDYYTTGHGMAMFARELKNHVVFADHSLATDSVFSEVHLVSCRNVLIYFNRALQNRALGLFRDALVRHGFLGLGARETVQFSSVADAFEPVADAPRVYRRR